MNIKLSGSMIAVLVLSTTMAQAAPEQMVIIPVEKQNKERTAASRIRQIDLRDIEDPAARKAIGEILNYLDLKYKK